MSHYKYLGMLMAYSCLSTSAVLAAPIVYQPINPSFGGNPNNITSLMQNSRQQSQKEKQPESSSATEESSSQKIADQLTNSLVTELVDEAYQEIYGAGAQPSGIKELGGGNRISWSTSGSVITVTIRDSRGAETILDLPVR